MFGNSLEEGLLLQKDNPAHTSVTFPGIAATVLIWLIALAVFATIDYAPLPTGVVALASLLAGGLTGFLLTRTLRRRRREHRERAAADFRAAQEAETQRKLKDAREAGLFD
ncbi:MAG: hypothetical protein ACMVY4_09795 [Minwuia sp.]|uniref:hypothetical protein n=1 Tax=Minwuia sp. TaxID=2493630 RepID=UPI003A8560CD